MWPFPTEIEQFEHESNIAKHRQTHCQSYVKPTDRKYTKMLTVRKKPANDEFRSHYSLAN